MRYINPNAQTRGQKHGTNRESSGCTYIRNLKKIASLQVLPILNPDSLISFPDAPVEDEKVRKFRLDPISSCFLHDRVDTNTTAALYTYSKRNIQCSKLPSQKRHGQKNGKFPTSTPRAPRNLYPPRWGLEGDQNKCEAATTFFVVTCGHLPSYGLRKNDINCLSCCSGPSRLSPCPALRWFISRLKLSRGRSSRSRWNPRYW